ncbi:recombinase family protein [Clostridium sp. CS001]|uniref:recombinase family protein n=1 Tax=Clostridium sp. CS001 TaxID=2880648 RepID=UPI001CF57CFE|nr:recombinase family protein [Clostridium sp. CS001]MCB2289765.1 recombinase family protein [Clostridium sp. CS001]
MSEDKIIKNVVAYRRVSTNMQTEGFSLDGQKDSAINYCDKEGYTILEHYEDAGISGKSIENRPSLRKMLKRLSQKPKIDAVVIYKLSRISRNMADLVDIVKVFKENDVALISVSDGLDTSKSFGEAFVYMAGIFAQLELENIASQSFIGRQQKHKQGGWNGGTVPFGYKLEASFKEKNGKTVKASKFVKEENNKEWEVVQKIFDLYTNKGWGYDKILQYLNGKGIKTKKGKAFASVAIVTILENPFYCGYIRYGQYKNWSEERRKGKVENVEIIKAEDGLIEPLITKELWEKTQESRKLRTIKNEKKVNIKYLLSGIPTCPSCGAKMIFYRGNGKKDKDGNVTTYYRYYACGYWMNHKADLCKSNLVKADIIENQVIEEVKKFADNPNLIPELERRLSEKVDTFELEDEIKEIKKNISDLERKKDKNYKRLEDEEQMLSLDEKELIKRIATIADIIKKLEKELLLKQSQLAGIKVNSLDIGKIALMLKNFNKVFASTDYEKQKKFIHLLIKDIKIAPAKKINDRKAIEIILNFSDANIMEWTKSEKKIDDNLGVRHGLSRRILLLVLFHLYTYSFLHSTFVLL